MRSAWCSLNAARNDAVDLLRARQVVAERLLEHDAHLRAVQPGRAELRADQREQVRAGRQEQHHRVGVGAHRASPSGAA